MRARDDRRRRLVLLAHDVLAIMAADGPDDYSRIDAIHKACCKHGLAGPMDGCTEGDPWIEVRP